VIRGSLAPDALHCAVFAATYRNLPQNAAPHCNAPGVNEH